MNLDGVYELIRDMCSFTTLALILIAVGSILIFFRIFKSDFNQPD